VETKTITVVSSLSLLRETMRYWILSFLDSSVVISTADFTNKLADCNLCLALVLNENELLKIQKLLENNLDLKILAVVNFDFHISLDKKIKVTNLKNSINHIFELLELNDYNFWGVSEKSNEELTLRENEVLDLIAQGFCFKEISYRLGISKHTVVAHKRNLFLKTGSKNLQQLTLYATMHKNSTSKL
jgi:DNA-binding CsgD family transcriptional regulator